jgi:hypothetical protein
MCLIWDARWPATTGGGYAAFDNGKSLLGGELAIARCNASADNAALRSGTKARFKWASGSSLAPSTQVRLPEVS